MLNDDAAATLDDPSLLLFGDLPVSELSRMFSNANALEIAEQTGLKAETVEELANEVTRYRRQVGWNRKFPN